ncbi:hypothetical protein LSTR_LSTR015138 [Laodelphax striatellus]|uniref:PDZ domain-containing protein n=1 Tax=Laodelphax striatellus TaxID=195883 RepID=A0A482XLC3_LAOST|nr:hypothetical protein LSTR_LSTR015138 [Laodelphax striatellus]
MESGEQRRERESESVNGNSLAEKAGLQVGDAVIKVNGHEVFNLRHKDAQDIIVRSGNNIEITIQRGGAATWKPAVQPVGSGVTASPHLPSKVAPVTKTSLAAKPQPPSNIGSAHNLSPRPFNQVKTKFATTKITHSWIQMDTHLITME